MTLPANYAWLADEGAPRMLVEALKLYGTIELPGDRDSPTILGWAKEIGIAGNGYTHDSIPWCGLFMAVVATRAGKTPPKNPLWALNWAGFGTGQSLAGGMLGDVLTFKRPGGGHVALYVGEDPVAFHVIGGNQSDAVTITREPRTRLHSVARPTWQIAQPANVRKIRLSPAGALSTNEA